MPFKSAKQERYMWAKHPKIARRWKNKYGSKQRASAQRRKAAARKAGKASGRARRRRKR